jgi:hypothetical protein
VLEFKAWESFYVIVGSSGAALTGLQFVVIALVVDVDRRSSTKEIDAFATPTIVHFCAALLISGILSAPWPSTRMPALLLGATGVAGAMYALLTARRAARQTGYHPVLEDWLFHVALPLAAYVTIGVAALFLHPHIDTALVCTAAATLLLLFIGIHNAWDTVTFIAFGDPPRREQGEPPPAVRERPKPAGRRGQHGR